MTESRADFEERMKAAKEAETEDHQHQWEAAILATLLHHINSEQSELKWQILERLDVEDLTRSDHKAIYTAVGELYAAGDGVDASIVKGKLQAMCVEFNAADVDAVFQVPPLQDPSLLKTYINRVVNRGRLRRAKTYVRSVLAALEETETAEPDAVNDAIAKVQTTAFDLGKTQHLTGDVKTVAEELDSFMLDLENRKSEKGFIGLDTGFQHLNQVLNGLNPGLYTIGAPPSAGKTSYAKQTADQVLDSRAKIFSRGIGRVYACSFSVVGSLACPGWNTGKH